MLFVFATEYYACNLNTALLRMWKEAKARHKAQERNFGVPRFTTRTISWEDHNDYPTIHTRMKGMTSKLLQWAPPRRPLIRIAPEA